MLINVHEKAFLYVYFHQVAASFGTVSPLIRDLPHYANGLNFRCFCYRHMNRKHQNIPLPIRSFFHVAVVIATTIYIQTFT